MNIEDLGIDDQLITTDLLFPHLFFLPWAHLKAKAHVQARLRSHAMLLIYLAR